MTDKFAGRWRKPSRSNGSGNCVEVAVTPDEVAVRDSKDPEAGYFVLPAAGWQGLLVAVRSQQQ